MRVRTQTLRNRVVAIAAVARGLAKKISALKKPHSEGRCKHPSQLCTLAPPESTAGPIFLRSIDQAILARFSLRKQKGSAK
jgi:hypothetical protein